MRKVTPEVQGVARRGLAARIKIPGMPKQQPPRHSSGQQRLGGLAGITTAAKIILPVKNGVAYTLEGVALEGPEALSAYCNATSTAVGYLYWIYNLERSKFPEGSRGLELLAELKTILNGGN